jgi:hypothetical protein
MDSMNLNDQGDEQRRRFNGHFNSSSPNTLSAHVTRALTPMCSNLEDTKIVQTIVSFIQQPSTERSSNVNTTPSVLSNYADWANYRHMNYDAMETDEEKKRM